jgi:hypothetical protein
MRTKSARTLTSQHGTPRGGAGSPRDGSRPNANERHNGVVYSVTCNITNHQLQPCPPGARKRDRS